MKTGADILSVFQVVGVLNRGGGEKAAVLLARPLPDLGYQPRLLVLGGGSNYLDTAAGRLAPTDRLRLFDSGIAALNVFARLRTMWRIGWHLFNTRPHLLHSHLRPALVYVALPAVLLRIPVVYTVHNKDELGSGGSGVHRWWRYCELAAACLLSRCSILCVSRDIADEWAEVSWIYGRLLGAQPNGVELAGLPRAPENGGGEPIIGIVGRLVDRKRVGDALKAFQLLGVGNARLWIVGDGPERSHLEKTADELGIASRVRFWGVRDDVGSLMARMSVIWQLSEWEGQPLTLLEAMAVGIPIVATAVPGTAELIQDSINGRLAPLGAVQRVATLTQELFAKEDLRNHLVRNGRQTAEKHSMDAILRMHIAHYRATRATVGNDPVAVL